MPLDVVVEAAQKSRLSPQRIFFLAHRENKEEADYFYHEWLIYDTTTPQVERFCLRVFSERHKKGGGRVS